MATRVAGKTPHGARPNREVVAVARASGRRRARMAHPILPGRLRDLASDGGTRGMVVALRSVANAKGGTEFGLRLTAIVNSLNHSSPIHGFVSCNGGRGFHRLAPRRRIAATWSPSPGRRQLDYRKAHHPRQHQSRGVSGG